MEASGQYWEQELTKEGFEMKVRNERDSLVVETKNWIFCFIIPALDRDGNGWYRFTPFQIIVVRIKP